MTSRALLAAWALFALPALLSGQDSKPDDGEARRIANWSRGTDRERLAVLFFLEDSRSGDPAAWKVLLDRTGDPRFFARVVRGLGRVAEPELKPLLVDVLDRQDVTWTSDLRRAAGLAVGLFGDPDLLPKLAARATQAEVFFAAGLMKALPAHGRDRILGWSGPGTESRPRPGDVLDEPVEASLRYGAAVEEPALAVLAQKVLTTHGESPDRTLAAVDYFARAKAKAPADLRPRLTELLSAGSTELAGLAARALAKSEGAGDPEALAIEAAFLNTADAVSRVDQVRALAALPVPKSCEALVRLLALSKGDPAVRRTVLESLKTVAPRLPEDVKKLASATMAGIVQPIEGARSARPDVRAAAVGALAALDRPRFNALLPALRLAAPWPVRGAAGAAVVSVPSQQWTWRFLEDPDRRVRIATSEAIADLGSEVPWMNFGAASGHIFTRTREPGTASDSDSSLRTADPVELSLIARFYASYQKQLDPKTFLGDATALIPDHEVEALQPVLDLAAGRKSDFGNDVLRRYLRSPEISLRKRAKALLAKNGIDAKEEAPPGANPGFNTERVDRLLENPAPAAVIETNRGNVTIQLLAGDAPATVENFLKLAKRGFYDGILWHRVVPAFVAQAGCPRGDGWGGPGYTIRCEVNDRTYRRGSVGMALAGKDTGGSQFFICHRALPHLDGRYTLFGQVIEGMDVVDVLSQDDWIVRVREL